MLERSHHDRVCEYEYVCGLLTRRYLLCKHFIRTLNIVIELMNVNLVLFAISTLTCKRAEIHTLQCNDVVVTPPTCLMSRCVSVVIAHRQTDTTVIRSC